MVTTMTPVLRTIRLPSCWLELPLVSPPPWIQKYTGTFCPLWTPAGRWTLRNRQSSVSERGPLVLAWAGQRLPQATASRRPLQAGAGRGGRQRTPPTGGAAYGMPRKPTTAPPPAPRSSPVWTRTTGAWLAPGGPAWLAPGGPAAAAGPVST